MQLTIQKGKISEIICLYETLKMKSAQMHMLPIF
jgi:hypothetical protein